MKIQTSYFYQVRFMKPNMIPLSTAKWDPRWFHKNNGQSFQFKDKNGVWNGLRAEPFVPGESCDGLCRGPEYCNSKDPNSCQFLKAYYNQLNELNFEEIINRFEILGKTIQKDEGFIEEPILILLVHEAFTNPCSERWAIQKWFKDHNFPITEFRLEDILVNF